MNRNFFDFLYIIGRGGFGKVWKVRLKKNNEFFALKEMSKVKIIDRRSEISIMSERNLLSKLHHPFIVNMYFAFQDFYNLYLVLDLLTGGDLRYHIAQRKTFDESQTKFFIANILLALDYIHSQNIIHRDIKPENLVLDKNGYLRITDFGVAKINELDNSSETSGTPGYMAPEVILVQNHGPPSDFFALGVIGYEFMLGYRPYLGRGRKEIKKLIISKQARINREELPENWSENSRDCINLLLQRKPKKRLGYNGVDEIKQHPWMRDIDWDLLFHKKIEAPFIPPIEKENFDKKYCEGEDKIGETTKERYELYFSSELYEGVFKNYTYLNKNYVNDCYKNNQNIIKQEQINKVLKNNNNKNNINYTNRNYQTIDYEKNNKNVNNINNEEMKLNKNTIDYESKYKLNQDNKENKSENEISSLNNNKINEKNDRLNNIEKSGKKQYLRYHNQSSSMVNLNYKFNAPLVNENIICNNYINFNFNNYPNNSNNNNNIKNRDTHSFNENIIIQNDKIDVSSLKQLLNSHESNDINIYNKNGKANNYYENKINNKNKNINNINNDNSQKQNSANIIIPKSSSMKYLNKYPNKNNITNHFLSDNKRTTKIVLIKNLDNNDNNNNTNISNNIIMQKNSFGLRDQKPKMNRGLSDYNLKIDTNNLDLISIKEKFGKNSDKRFKKNKTLNKTTSYDTINVGNIGNNIKIKNTDLDNKVSKWILKNLNQKKNQKNLKLNNQFSTINMINENIKYILNINNINNNNKYNYMKKNNKTNSMINMLSENSLKKDRMEYLFKNKQNQNFPSINNISKNLNKKSFDLNTNNMNINTKNRQISNQKRSFNTINFESSNSNMNKVQSLKNIYKPSINNNNPNFLKIKEKAPPISFNYFNFNGRNKTRNKNKNNNLFNRNMNLNFETSDKSKNKNYNLSNRIGNFNY